MPATVRKKKTKAKVRVGVLAASTKQPGKILLVTSRQSKSWALPKGHVERLLGLSASARREAYEEAGVRGRMTTAPIGSYIHHKSARDVFRVRVFKLHVPDQRSKWPEKKERKRRWVSVESAFEVGLQSQPPAIYQAAPCVLSSKQDARALRTISTFQQLSMIE